MKTNLIIEYLKAHDGSIAAARDYLSEAMGKRITSGRLYEWRDGVQTPPPEALREMAELVAQSAAEEVIAALGLPRAMAINVPDETLELIAQMMTPPPRRKKTQDKAALTAPVSPP